MAESGYPQAAESNAFVIGGGGGWIVNNFRAFQANGGHAYPQKLDGLFNFRIFTA